MGVRSRGLFVPTSGMSQGGDAGIGQTVPPADTRVDRFLPEGTVWVMLLSWWLYAPAAVWLVVCAAVGFARVAIPTPVMVSVWLAAPWWVWWTSSWVDAAVSSVVSVGVFGFFVFTGAVKRSTTVAVVPAVAALPPVGWLPLLAGALIAGAWSLLLVRRAFGSAHVGGVAVGTLHAMGVGGAGPRLFGLGKPRLGELPVSTATRQPRLPLALLLAGAVVSAMLVSFVTAG